MPELSRFYGIVIKMYWNDHAPPHFHAEHAGREALIDIDPLQLRRGSLSPRALRLVLEWAALHQQELREQWEKAQRPEPTGWIAPLP